MCKPSTIDRRSLAISLLTALPLLSLLELSGGLLLLITGAELLVRAAVGLAARLQVRPLIIGLTVVAFGSSAPQMAVSLQATLAQNADIAVGSVIGSGIFNILVTLGLSALIIPLRVSRQLVRLDIPLMIGASLLVFVLAWNETLTQLDGVLLLVALAIYLGLLLRQSRHSGRPHAVAVDVTPASWFKSLSMIVLGLAMLIFAGHLLLGAAVEVATDLGLSERIIGLTIVAVSTSLPELATSLIAALRGQRDIAVGNVIGSNLFNLLGVLGVTALVAPSPLSVSPNALDFDLPVMLGVAVLCLPVFYSGYRVTRAEGLLFLGLYLAYGLHVVSFTTGMPLAGQLERLMLFYVLPALLAFLLYTSVRAWRRQHHKRDLP
ncbi:cation:H+ antiporter [Pseudomonas sp. NFACC32-1]|nr:cation:H+ antiporter [Pseudomonas sp. NFACC32-1]SFW18461.1 cation:H+ antiporter [Pseudomonas sp. NFACC09-4]SFX04908.1 cation:H+ antiporter [Pseudomonas sp. NFACC36]SIR93062.1 cation:H+ antiporter [Pseudomonas sp. 7SR1]